MFYFLFIAELEKLVRDFHSRIERLEGDKWDLEHQIKMKDYQVRGSLPRSLLHGWLAGGRLAARTPLLQTACRRL